jgi:hypothetical protein
LVLGRAETPTALLVLLGAWCDTIDSKVEHATWLHNFVESISVSEDLLQHCFLVKDNHFVRICVSTLMDDAIHIFREIDVEEEKEEEEEKI